MDLYTVNTRVSAVTATCRIKGQLTGWPAHNQELAAEVQRVTPQLLAELEAQGLVVEGPTKHRFYVSSDVDELAYLQNQLDFEVTVYADSGSLKAVAEEADKWRELQKKEQAVT